MTVLVTGGRGAIARATTAGLRAAGETVRVGGREPAALDDPAAVLVDLTRPKTFPAALDGVAPAEACRQLVLAGVAVSSLVVERPSLEDLFVGMTGEGFDVAR